MKTSNGTTEANRAQPNPALLYWDDATPGEQEKQRRREAWAAGRGGRGRYGRDKEQRGSRGR